MKKALLCDTLSAVGMIHQPQNRSTLTVNLPSGEYRLKQSRHCKVFSAPLPRLLCNNRVSSVTNIHLIAIPARTEYPAPPDRPSVLR